ncbi:MAG: hypothetical protein MI920_29480 [Kiloniellales bacterium]|nr:hypothetical protein [Kiloniellales bacterium]
MRLSWLSALLLLCSLPLGAAALAQEEAACVTCPAKSFSKHRSDGYLAKALEAETEKEKALWLSIALRYDPGNATAKRLLDQLTAGRPQAR